jgi:hypothetical protein
MQDIGENRLTIKLKNDKNDKMKKCVCFRGRGHFYIIGFGATPSPPSRESACEKSDMVFHERIGDDALKLLMEYCDVVTLANLELANKCLRKAARRRLWSSVAVVTFMVPPQSKLEAFHQ